MNHYNALIYNIVSAYYCFPPTFDWVHVAIILQADQLQYTKKHSQFFNRWPTISSAVIMKIFIVAIVALLILSVVDTSQSYALEREDVDDLDCVHDEGII